MFRVSTWVVLGVLLAIMFGWSLNGAPLGQSKQAGWPEFGSWGWGKATTTGNAKMETTAATAKSDAPAKPAEKKELAADKKAAKEPAGEWKVTKANEKPTEAPAKPAAKEKEVAKQAAPIADAPKPREAAPWSIEELAQKGVDIDIDIPGFKKKPAEAPAEKPVAKTAEKPAEKAATATADKGVAHPSPWPIATEVPNWGKVMNVPAPKADEPKQAAAPSKGATSALPWPIADKPVKWDNVRVAAPAPEAPAPAKPSVASRAIDWVIADKPVKWDNVRIAAPAPEAPAPAKPSVASRAIDWPIADKPVKWDNVRIAAPAPEAPAPAKPSVATRAIEWVIVDKPVKWDNVRIAAPAPEAPAPAKPSVAARAIEWVIVDKPVKWDNVRIATPAPAPAREAEWSVTAPAIEWPIAKESVRWTNVRVAAADPAPAPEPIANKGVPHPMPWPIATEVPKWDVAAAPLPKVQQWVPPAEETRRAALSVEQVACEDELRRIYKSGTILFKTNSAEIDPRSTETLDALATAAKNCAKARIRVEGHTDSRGSAAYNKSLSERRAQSVASYLTKAGVAQGLVSAVGYGLERPVAPNDVEANMSKNRRIEFTVQ